MPTATQAPVAAKDLLPEASVHVYEVLKARLPDTIHFHTYEHALEVVGAAKKIGRKEGIDGNDLALLTLAAWFHDVGFVETYDDHEAVSAKMAAAFLEEHHLPDDDIEQVKTLIVSTHRDHTPETTAERVLRDADIIHIGKKKKFFRYGDRLRKEWEALHGKTYTDLEWAEVQLDFLTTTPFETDYARKRYGDTKARNLEKVQRTLAGLLDAPKLEPEEERPKRIPKRGKETMFRTAYRNHINLSSIADGKANIMISINAILMSIIVSFVTTRLQEDPWLLIPSVAMLVTSLIAIIFAILSARPKVTSKIYSLEDIRQSKANILFFGNFINLPQAQFREGIRELMEDWDMLYDSMSNDLYGLGTVLSKKYKLLWISFTVFMIGLVITVLLFLFLFFGLT